MDAYSCLSISSLSKSAQPHHALKLPASELRGHVCFSFRTNSKVLLCYAVLSRFSRIQLCATLRTLAHQDPLSIGFSRQEYWSGLLFPPPEDLPDPGIEPTSLTSLALPGMFFTTSATWEAQNPVEFSLYPHSDLFFLALFFSLYQVEDTPKLMGQPLTRRPLRSLSHPFLQLKHLGFFCLGTYCSFMSLHREGNGTPLQYSCLGNPIDRGAW